MLNGSPFLKSDKQHTIRKAEPILSNPIDSGSLNFMLYLIYNLKHKNEIMLRSNSFFEEKSKNSESVKSFFQFEDNPDLINEPLVQLIFDTFYSNLTVMDAGVQDWFHLCYTPLQNSELNLLIKNNENLLSNPEIIEIFIKDFTHLENSLMSFFVANFGFKSFKPVNHNKEKTFLNQEETVLAFKKDISSDPVNTEYPFRYNNLEVNARTLVETFNLAFSSMNTDILNQVLESSNQQIYFELQKMNPLVLFHTHNMLMQGFNFYAFMQQEITCCKLFKSPEKTFTNKTNIKDIPLDFINKVQFYPKLVEIIIKQLGKLEEAIDNYDKANPDNGMNLKAIYNDQKIKPKEMFEMFLEINDVE